MTSLIFCLSLMIPELDGITPGEFVPQISEHGWLVSHATIESVANLRGAPYAYNIGPLCGPNSLFVLSRLQGKGLDWDSVAKTVNVDANRGASLADLVEAGARIGFPLKSRLIGARELESLNPPYIMHMTQLEESDHVLGHFLVVFEFDEVTRELGVIDGTSGKVSREPIKKFVRSFSGHVLLPARESSPTMLIGILLIALAAYLFLGHGDGKGHDAQN